MLPEIEQYFTARDAAESAYQAELQKLRAARTTEQQLHRQYDRQKQDAWEALQQSSDPLVRWIGTTFDHTSYRDEAREVLRLLPMTRDELEAFVIEKDCDTWTSYFNVAERDGVLPGSTSVSPEHAELEAWFTQNISRNSRHRAQLRRHVDSIVAKAKIEDTEPADEVE